MCTGTYPTSVLTSPVKTDYHCSLSVWGHQSIRNNASYNKHTFKINNCVYSVLLCDFYFIYTDVDFHCVIRLYQKHFPQYYSVSLCVCCFWSKMITISFRPLNSSCACSRFHLPSWWMAVERMWPAVWLPWTGINTYKIEAKLIETKSKN